MSASIDRTAFEMSTVSLFTFSRRLLHRKTGNVGVCVWQQLSSFERTRRGNVQRFKLNTLHSFVVAVSLVSSRWIVHSHTVKYGSKHNKSFHFQLKLCSTCIRKTTQKSVRQHNAFTAKCFININWKYLLFRDRQSAFCEFSSFRMRCLAARIETVPGIVIVWQIERKSHRFFVEVFVIQRTQRTKNKFVHIDSCGFVVVCGLVSHRKWK